MLRMLGRSALVSAAVWARRMLRVARLRAGGCRGRLERRSVWRFNLDAPCVTSLGGTS